MTNLAIINPDFPDEPSGLDIRDIRIKELTLLLAKKQEELVKLRKEVRKLLWEAEVKD